MTVPVVQGTPVHNPAGDYGQPSYSSMPSTQAQQMHYGAGYFGGKGEQQPKQFQDVLFAIAFLVHLAVMMVIMAMETQSAQENGYNYAGVMWCVSLCGVVALGLSTLALGFMMSFATQLVKMALIFSVAMSGVVCIMGFLTGQLWMGLVGLISFLLGCCYAYFVWGRVPFAAANLRTALTAVRQNMGLTVVAYLFLALAFGWSLWWTVSVGAAVKQVSFVLFLFLVSYYWVHQVLTNTVHVTSAGVIGTWWFVPEEASACCSPAIMDSLARATTYSFGSICFGSLLVALVQALRTLYHIARNNDDCSIVVCLIDCILACIQGIIEYLNRWAYIYVGLYGYGYLDAGRNVITLFQQRGWSTIITDDLAENVLTMMSVAIGMLTGLVGWVIGKSDADLFEGVGLGDSGLAGFLTGLLIGFLFSSIMMGVVSSAVATVIVLFAESPAEFEANHPLLSQEMRNAWRQAWPVECANL